MTQNTFSLWIMIIGVLITPMCIFLEKRVTSAKKNREKTILILCSLLIVGSGVFLRYYKFEPESFNTISEDELLKKGEDYFKMGDYFNAISIYTVESLDTNSIALSNLGYFHENGLSIQKDIPLARKYYLKAKQLGGDKELTNWIAFNIKYPISFEEVMQCIDEGYERENLLSTEFMSKCMSGGQIDLSSEAQAREEAKKFYQLSDETKKHILQETMYEQCIRGEDFFNKGTDFGTYTVREYNEPYVIGVQPYKQLTEDGTEITAVLPVIIQRTKVVNDIIEKRFIFADGYETEFIYR